MFEDASAGVGRERKIARKEVHFLGRTPRPLHNSSQTLLSNYANFKLSTDLAQLYTSPQETPITKLAVKLV